MTAFDAGHSSLGFVDITGGTAGCCAGPGDGTGSGDGRPSEFSFSGLGTDIALIRIEYTGPGSTSPGFGFDNFNATGASSFVPEPGTAMLLGLALAGLGAVGRRH